MGVHRAGIYFPSRRVRMSVSHEVYERGHRERRRAGGKLSELLIDKVEVQKEILKKQLEEEDIPDGLSVEIKNELGRITRRCESSREEDAKQRKRPLLASQELSDIEQGANEGIPPVRWGEWVNKSIEEQRE